MVASVVLASIALRLLPYEQGGDAVGPHLTPPPVAGPPVLVGAGDIASCSRVEDEATAALVAGVAGTVFTTGDNAYDAGSATEYGACYDASWGAFRDRTRPVPGNHEYGTRGAAGYFGYFGALAGTAGQGWYAYDIGAWRAYALNSNCSAIGGCGPGSAQLEWLRADLASNPRDCVVAYWHHPRFSSGNHGDQPLVAPLWEVLYEADADVILAGHDHMYERFAPMSPSGVADAERGIRSWVIGTGGKDLYRFRSIHATSEARDATTHGVLRLTLGDGRYEWQYLATDAAGFTDSGSATCH